LINTLRLSVFPHQRARYVHAGRVLQPLRGTAPRVDSGSLGPRAQEPDSAAVSDAYEEVQVQGQCLASGDYAVASSILISDLYAVA
jgi:hypothetical protein